MNPYFPLDNHFNNLYGEIGETIKQLYPIGLARETDEYKAHPGIKSVTKVFEENGFHNAQFNKPWKEFLKKIKSGTKKKIHNISYLTNPSFSGELILERYHDDALCRVKKIVFSVSQVANFFTIYGVDETYIKEREKPSLNGYHAINVITESPYSEFESSFNYIHTAIAAHFVEYKLVPIRASLYTVKDLQTPYSDLQECSIHNALFDNSFDYQQVRFFRGEMFYGAPRSNIDVVLLPPPVV